MSILDRIRRLERSVRLRDFHLAEIERRLANVMRAGTIDSVDAKNGTVRVKIGTDPDGKPVLTPPLPWTERAGTIKTWSPPAKGETVRVMAPSGELAQGWIDAGGFSTANRAPSDDGEAHVMTIGDMRITAKDGLVSIVQGDAEIRMEGGKVLVKGAEIVTDGPTKLDKGDRKVHYVGGRDDAGDRAVDGASRVFV